MKLKTKLIPLAGVAAVCATVAPITITSCTGGSSNGNGLVDLTTRYTPKLEKLGHCELTFSEANNYYTDKLESYPELFAEDYYWYNSNNIWQSQIQIREAIDDGKEIRKQAGDIAEKLRDMAEKLEKKGQKKEAIAYRAEANRTIEAADSKSEALIIDVIDDVKQQEEKKYGPQGAYLAGVANKHAVKFSDISVTHSPYPFTDIAKPMNVPVISFTLEYKIDYDYSRAAMEKGLVARVETGTLKVTNIPLIVEFDTNVDARLWNIHPFARWMETEQSDIPEHPHWTIESNSQVTSTYQRSSSVSGESTYTQVTNSNINYDSGDYQSWSIEDGVAIQNILNTNCATYSWYFYSVSQGQEGNL